MKRLNIEEDGRKGGRRNGKRGDRRSSGVGRVNG